MTVFPQNGQLTSLLEQCLLYNRPDFRPFAGSPACVRLETEDTTITAAVSSASIGLENRLPARYTQAAGDVAPLFRVDLDFSLPLKQYATRVTTPLSKTTNRRSVGVCRAEKQYDSPSAVASSRKRGKLAIDYSPSETVEDDQFKGSTSSRAFLSLPGELRAAIYAQLFVDARVYISQRPASTHAFDHHPAIRSTCKTIHIETERLYFKTLTVNLIYEVSSLIDRSNIRDLIPLHVSEKLESLVILKRFDSAEDVKGWKLDRLPSLLSLTIQEWARPRRLASRFRESHLQSYTVETKDKLTSLAEYCLPESFWQNDRKFSIRRELIHMSWDRGARLTWMGPLSKRKYSFVLISISGDKKNDVSRQELSLEQIIARQEMYYWMANRLEISARAWEDTDASKFVEWLAYAQYHASLDEIEAGVGKTMQNSIVTLNNVETIDKM